ncbi:MAG: GNAT family N-acetyltransferase [Gammaproteobacteria bacterium]|nr:GNAT family N-acetyltransferase [Gammaproteobacteria bacterium]
MTIQCNTACAHPDFSVRFVCNPAEIQDTWNLLQADCDVESPVFMQFQWFYASLQWQPEKGQPSIILISEGAQPLGICALSTISKTWLGMPVRQLEFLKVADTQQCEFLTNRDVYNRFVAALAGVLTARKDWDIIYLTKMVADSKKQNEISLAFKSAGLSSRWMSDSSNPTINLNQSWSEYYAGRSRRLKKGNNLIANKLKEKYQSIEIEWLYGDKITEEQWQKAIEEIIRVSAASWKNATGLTLDNPGPQAFIRSLSKQAIKAGWLSIWLLKLNGKTAAMEYQLIYNGNVHALRADYDASLAELSPGSYLNWKLLERLLGKGFLRYEMGPGDNAYKQRWAENEVKLSALKAYNRTFIGTLLGIIDRQLKPVARKLLSVANTFRN